MSLFYERTVREIPHIEQPAIKYAEQRGWFQCKFVAPGLRGMPDRFMVRRGRIVLAEFKAPGEVPTPQQARRHRELRAHGVEVVWFDNIDDVHDFFR